MTHSGEIVVSTELGNIHLTLEETAAPVSVCYFRHLIRTGQLNETSFFRIVAERNQHSDEVAKINVIQGGGKPPDDGKFDYLEHESTDKTGLRHQPYSIALARFEPGQVYGSFFITLREEPSLDFGGARHKDGKGFAVFGSVSSGFEVVRDIYLLAEESDFLKREVKITTVIER